MGTERLRQFGRSLRFAGRKVTGPPVTGKTETPDIPKLNNSASSIAVLVNELPITRYDIAQRQKLMALGGAKTSSKLATDELIDEIAGNVRGQEAGPEGARVQVNDAFASISQRLKMTSAQFSQGLASRGVDANSLKQRLRAQITWQYLVQRRTQ